MTTETFAQRCLDLRGYVVIGTNERLNVGSVCKLDDQPGTRSDAEGMVIAKTNRNDMVEQLRALGFEDEIPRINAQNFYRIVAE